MKTRKGFSLVELLVVIAIIGIMAGYTIMRLVDNRYDVELTSAGNITQSTIIRARDMSRTPQQGGNLSDTLVVNGYGVQLPLVGATDINLTIFRDTIDSTMPTNENKFSTGDVSISTSKLKESDIANVKVLKYIYYDINNVMSEDTNTTLARDIVFDSKEVPSDESVFYNQNNVFTKIGVSLQHTVTKKEVRVWINANGDISIEEYSPVMFALTVNVNGSGTTSVSSGSQFEQGSSIVVNAAASSGYTFGSWSGCSSVSETNCTVVMSSNKTITVTFNAIPACGDGSCNGAETCSTCAGDCGVCPVPIQIEITNLHITRSTTSFGLGCLNHLQCPGIIQSNSGSCTPISGVDGTEYTCNNTPAFFFPNVYQGSFGFAPLDFSGILGGFEIRPMECLGESSCVHWSGNGTISGDGYIYYYVKGAVNVQLWVSSNVAHISTSVE